jgi:hypothetical protein
VNSGPLAGGTVKTGTEYSALKARLTEEIRVEAVLATAAH